MRRVGTFFKAVGWVLVALWACHLIGYVCKRDVDRVMPRWPLAYARVDDPGAMLSAVMRLPGFDEGLLEGVRGDRRAAALSKWLLRCAAGRRIALGLYHSVKKEERIDALAVVDMGYAGELLARTYFSLLSFSDDPAVEHWRGVNILRLRHAFGEVVVTQRGGKVFVSDDAYWIKRALSQKGFSPIRDSEFHKAFMRARPPRSSFAAYLDTARINQYLVVNEGRFPQAAAFFEPLVKDGITLDGISRIALCGAAGRRSLDVRVSVEYEHEELSYVVSRYFERESRANTSLEYVPATVDGYAWAGNVSPALFWVLWANGVGEQRYAAVRQSFFEKTGLDIEKDIIEALGQEYGVFGDVSGEFPRGVAFLSVKDGLAINKLLDLFKTQSMRTQEYRGRSMTVYDDLAESFGVHPAYMFEGGRLLLASDVSSLFDVIDTKDGQRDAFTKNAVFAPGRVDPRDSSRTWAYLGVGRAVDGAIGCARRLAAHPRYRPIIESSFAGNGVTSAQWAQFKNAYAVPLAKALRGIESAVFRMHAVDGKLTADAHLYFAPQHAEKQTRDSRERA